MITIFNKCRTINFCSFLLLKCVRNIGENMWEYFNDFMAEFCQYFNFSFMWIFILPGKSLLMNAQVNSEMCCEQCPQSQYEYVRVELLYTSSRLTRLQVILFLGVKASRLTFLSCSLIDCFPIRCFSFQFLSTFSIRWI